MTSEEIARIALQRESQPAVQTQPHKKEKPHAIDVSPSVDIEAEALRRMQAEATPTAPPPLPSREEWQARNPGADYDKAMQERQDNPMTVVEDDADTKKYKEIQEKLKAADLALDERKKKESYSGSYLPVGGALVGAHVARKNQQAEAAEGKYGHLPPEMRPVDSGSLQRYINSQFKYQIPLEKLKELTGVDIRTMKEVQDARKIVEGFEAQRIPVKKDVNDRTKTVSYRNIPGSPAIDISEFGQPVTMGSRIRDAAINTAKSVGTNYGLPIVGGSIAVPQLIQSGMDYFRNKPVDPYQVASGLGGVGMMTRSKPLGILGGLAQLPYAIKHKDELLNSMTMNDVNPLAFPAGTAESASSPMEEPMSFNSISGVLQRANEEQRRKLGYR
jgi:hypothetical protein